MSNQKVSRPVGKPRGSKHVKTIRKQAVQNLKDVALDESAPILAKTIASAMLLGEIKP